jgi:hypothetical protein
VESQIQVSLFPSNQINSRFHNIPPFRPNSKSELSHTALRIIWKDFQVPRFRSRDCSTCHLTFCDVGNDLKESPRSLQNHRSLSFTRGTRQVTRDRSGKEV